MIPAKKDLRSLDQNALFHVILREILNHLIANGVKLPAGDKGEALIKTLVKSQLGAKIKVNGIKLDLPTSMYLTDDDEWPTDDERNRSMTNFIGRIVAWSAMDLDLILQI